MDELANSIRQITDSTEAITRAVGSLALETQRATIESRDLHQLVASLLTRIEEQEHRIEILETALLTGGRRVET